jgi:four helix bundle protein
MVAWQLAHELENEIFAFTSKPPASHDVKYCNQIQEAIRSAPRNTSEGFGRFYPKEFSRYLRIAAASLHETKNQLHEGYDRQYLTQTEHDRLVRLNVRAIAANAGLLRYLAGCKPPKPFRKPKTHSIKRPES